MTGTVTPEMEAVVRLVVRGADGQSRPVEAVRDTGFSGFLTLPPADVTALGLTWLGRENGVLADGRVTLFDVFRAAVE